MQSANSLPPVLPPIVVDQKYLRQTSTRLELDSVARLSGDNFLVKDESGQVIIAASGPQFSSLAKKNIFDACGQQLYEIKSDILTVRHAMTCSRGGVTVFKISRHKALLSKGEDKFEVTLYDNRTKEHRIDIVGDWNTFSGQLVLQPGRQVIGRISQQRAPNVGFEKGHDSMGHVTSQEKVMTSYNVDVAAGVDIAIVSVICMCCDIVDKSTQK